MNDAFVADETFAVLDALYRAAEMTPGVELLLNSIPTIEGSHATVSSVSVVLDGGLRDPGVRGCRRVTDSLHRDSEGRWHVEPRPDGVEDAVDVRPNPPASA